MTELSESQMAKPSIEWYEKRCAWYASEIDALRAELAETKEALEICTEEMAKAGDREVAQESKLSRLREERQDGRLGAIRAFHVTLDALGAPKDEWPCTRVNKLVARLREENERLKLERLLFLSCS